MDPFTIGGTIAAIIAFMKANAAILTVLVAAAGLTLASWAFIVHLFQVFLIPFLRNTLGDTVADGMAMIIGKVDDAATFTQRNVKMAWRAFKSNVLGWKTTFAKKSANTVTSRSEAYVHTPDQKVIRKVVEEEVDWADLPEDIRHAHMRNQGQIEVVDSKAATCRMVQAAASEKGIDLDAL